MEASSERPPGYTSHAPEDVILPSVPQHAPDQPLFQADITLPDLKTVLSSEFENRSTTPGSLTSHQLRHGSPTSVRSLPRIDPGYAVTTDVHSRSGDMHMGSPVETGSAMSGDDQTARSTSVSIDDPDVRLAAEALSEIGKPGKYCLAEQREKGALTSTAFSPFIGIPKHARVITCKSRCCDTRFGRPRRTGASVAAGL